MVHSEYLAGASSCSNLGIHGFDELVPCDPVLEIVYREPRLLGFDPKVGIHYCQSQNYTIVLPYNKLVNGMTPDSFPKTYTHASLSGRTEESRNFIKHASVDLAEL